MPITSSAKKALRSSARKRVFNTRRKEAFKKAEKKFLKLISEKKIDEAKSMMAEIQKAFDKAAKAGTIKKNTAARKKSRLMATLKKAS